MLELRWYVILCAVLLWLVISISALVYAVSWQQNLHTPSLLPPAGYDTCDRNFVLQAWIYNLASSNSCPIPSNGVVVINNVLYQKPLIHEGSCCYFSEVDLTRVPFPDVYIGQASAVFTDVELNSQSFVANSTRSSYSYLCQVCNSLTYQLILIDSNQYYILSSPIYHVYFDSTGFILSVTRNGTVVAQGAGPYQLVVYDTNDRIVIDLANINNKFGFQPLAVEF